jgi:isopenicillin N synthase-like dioxygenase
LGFGIARARAEKWIEAPALPGAFVVINGDCLRRWTNDVYVSSPHRVVSDGLEEAIEGAENEEVAA